MVRPSFFNSVLRNDTILINLIDYHFFRWETRVSVRLSHGVLHPVVPGGYRELSL